VAGDVARTPPSASRWPTAPCKVDLQPYGLLIHLKTRLRNGTSRLPADTRRVVWYTAADHRRWMDGIVPIGRAWLRQRSR
jgi:hypothetical protein